MLKHARGLIVLLVLGILLGVYIFVFDKDTEKTGTGKNFVNKPKAFFTECSKVEVKAEGLSVTLEKTDGVWHITSPIKYPADKSVVQNIIDEIDLGVADRTIKGDEVTQKTLQSYELSEPKYSVTLHSAEAEPITVHFGSGASFPKDYIFAQVSTSNSVYVVPGNIKKYISAKLDDYRNRTPIDFSVMDVASLSFSGRYGYSLEHKGTVWLVSSPFKALANLLSAEGLVGKVVDLSIQSFVDGKPTDFGKYGLEKPTLEIVVVSDAGKRKTLKIGSKVDPTLTPGIETSAYYARTEADPNDIFTIAEKAINDIGSDPLDIVESQLTNLAYTSFKRMTFKSVLDEFEIEMKDNHLKFVKPEEDEADGDAMDEFVKKLNALTSVEFETIEGDPAALGFDGSFVFEFNPSGNYYDTRLKVEIGKPDEETGSLRVRRNEEGIMLLFAPEKIASILAITKHVFYDRTIKRFSADDARFVSVMTEGNFHSFTKRDGEWKCDNKPDRIVDVDNLKKLLDDIDIFKVHAIMSLKDGDKWNTEPRSKVVVTSEKKDGDKLTSKTITFLFFGDWKDGDKKGVYARVEGDDFGFAVPDSIYQSLTLRFLKAVDYDKEAIGPIPPKDEAP